MRHISTIHLLDQNLCSLEAISHPFLQLPPLKKKEKKKTPNQAKQNVFKTAFNVSVGTFKIRGQDTIHHVLDAALAAGYRSFGKSLTVTVTLTGVGFIINDQ